MQQLNTGLTLIELMITVAIVGILAAIVYPAYTDYVLSSRRADARTTLLMAQLAQEEYRLKNNRYTMDFDELPGVSTDSLKGYYTIASGYAGPLFSGGLVYTITATPKTADNDCQIFVMTQMGKQTSDNYPRGDNGIPVADDDCWGG